MAIISILNILLVTAYLLVCILIGLLSFKRKSSENFLIAERKVKLVLLVTTLSASFIGGGLLVTFTALSFEYGISAIWMFVGASLALFAFPSLIGKKLKPLSDEHKFHTLSDYFYHKFGKRSGFISAILVFIMFFALLLVQFIAGGKVLSAISGWPYTLSVLITGIIIFLYLFLGGFSSVVKTDFFQFFIIILLIFILITSFKTVTINPEQFNPVSIGLGNIIGFSLIGLFAFLISADVWQRAYSAHSEKILKKGFYLAAIILILFGISISIIGIATKNNFPNIDAQDALYYGFSNLLPNKILVLGLIFIFASIMSTADTTAFVISMNISKDFISKFKTLSDDKLVKITRISLFSLILTSMLVAIFIQNIVDVVFAVVTIGLALAPAMMASFFWNLKEKAVFYSIFLGFLSAIILISIGYITPETSIITLPVSFTVLIFGQLAFKNPQNL